MQGSQHKTMSLFFILLFAPLITKAADNELAVSTKMLSNWFATTGLAKPSKGWKLDVKEISESVIPEYYREKCAEPKASCPEYEVTISFKHPEGIWHDAPDAWEILNKEAMGSEGATLDERIIFKVSHLLGVRADKIHVKYHTHCLSFGVMFRQNKVQHVSGEACMMAGASTLVTKELSDKVSSSLTRSLEDKVGIEDIKGTDVVEIINGYYSDKKAKVRIIASDNSYVSATITGLKKEVIPSENYWESIQLSFLISDLGDSINLRTLVDGQYAAGLREPSVLAYNDMEPSYTKDLQQYAGHILESIKIKLLKSDK